MLLRKKIYIYIFVKFVMNWIIYPTSKISRETELNQGRKTRMPEQSDGKRARDRQFFRREDSADDQKPLSSSAVGVGNTSALACLDTDRMWVASSKSTKRSVAYHVSCVPYTFTYDRGSFARHRAHKRKDWREREGNISTYIYIYIKGRERGCRDEG